MGHEMDCAWCKSIPCECTPGTGRHAPVDTTPTKPRAWMLGKIEEIIRDNVIPSMSQPCGLNNVSMAAREILEFVASEMRTPMVDASTVSDSIEHQVGGLTIPQSIHASDCRVHDAPAGIPGPCTCGQIFREQQDEDARLPCGCLTHRVQAEGHSCAGPAGEGPAQRYLDKE